MNEFAPPFWRRVIPELRWQVTVFLLSCFGAGVVAGIIWALAAYRPAYWVADDLGASLSERGLAGIFAADALFSVLVGIVGLAIGIAGWLAFHRTGWWVCVLTVVAAGLAGLLAWQVGLFVTPNNFAERLASAVGGDEVAVDLQLHAKAALLVAPFAAITPVMLLAAFWPERKEVPLVKDPAQDSFDEA